MSIVVFVLLGIAGCVFTRACIRSSRLSLAIELMLGITGSVTAGVFFVRFGAMDAAELTIGGLAGAIVPLAAYRSVFRESRADSVQSHLIGNATCSSKTSASQKDTGYPSTGVGNDSTVDPRQSHRVELLLSDPAAASR